MKAQWIGGLALLWTLTGPAHGQIDTISPWRVQLRVHTCDAGDAGTDSKVFVRLTSNPADRFWLAKGGNDRRRNQRDTYDMWIREPFDGTVVTLADVTEITFGITGSDKWCFDRVELFVNNPSPIPVSAHRIFDSGTVPGIWISEGDFGDSRVIGSQVTVVSNAASTPPLFRRLRGSLWNLSGARSAIRACPRVDDRVGIDRAVLEQMFESFLGHLMGPGEELAEYRYGARVGRAFVEVTRLSSDTIKVDADIVRGGLSGATRRWDVEIELHFHCSHGRLIVTPVQVDVDSRRWMDWLSLGLTRGFARLASGGLGVAPVGLPVPVCLPPQFNSDGDLTFESSTTLTCCFLPCV